MRRTGFSIVIVTFNEGNLYKTIDSILRNSSATLLKEVRVSRAEQVLGDGDLCAGAGRAHAFTLCVRSAALHAPG